MDSFLLWIQSWFGGANTTDLTPAQDCPLCVCGKTNLNRLLNGNETGVNQYPWMAILLYNNEFFCGGSLINDRFVLTAAHCFEFIEQNSIKNITVRLLEHDRSTDTETKLIDRNVQSVLIHPKFTDDTYNNDIVLVKFTKPVKFDEVLKPVCLPTPLLDYDGYNGVVTGWGATQRG